MGNHDLDEAMQFRLLDPEGPSKVSRESSDSHTVTEQLGAFDKRLHRSSPV